MGAAGTAGLVAFAAACSSGGGGDDDPEEGADDTPARPGEAAAAVAAPGSAGLIDEALWQERVEEYLAFAGAEEHPDNPTGIAVHLIRARRDEGYTWGRDDVSVDSLADVFQMIDDWDDTRDFNLMYFHWLWALGRGETAMTSLPEPVLDAIRERFVANRYRYDDPLPDDRIDNLWFWSENHRLIVLTDEHLAGQWFPDDTFTVTGLTGAEHRDRSKQPILDWIDERSRFGFFEWHSNVYMLKNITPLVTLIELADDPEIVAAAAMALDLCLADVAVHLQAGSYTAPHGRTYKKDKMTSRHEATFGSARLLFADTEEDFPSRTDTGATYLAAAERYRVPQAIVDVATTTETSVVRERHGIYVDAGAPVTDEVEAPFGYDFEDPANLPFWWSLGAVGMWQTIRVSVAEAEEHRLWDTELFTEIKALADLNGRDPERIREWVHARRAVVNFGFLSEANTYAWRSPQVALASVVDHRFGEMRDQAHSWKAQIDADALVFTTHPVTDLEPSLEWRDDGEPGYWTGEASMPRSAQHERTAIHIYQPAWDESTDDLLWAFFGYQGFTHAYFPQDRFDEVVQQGHWTIGAKDGGYIALWSWRAPTWRTYDPATISTDGMTQPFDLVAEGGPDNVWIVEVGTDDDGSLDDFVAAVTGSEPVVERTEEGFTVAWASPAAGEVTFGSTAPFTVAGDEVALGEFPRHESPWGTTDRLDPTFTLEPGDSRLALDFTARTRALT
ncbi:MAG TPA: hypothetical protein VFU19_14445 [Iamia sp.]|nr:hypothetical protein [Iamia sp.]